MFAERRIAFRATHFHPPVRFEHNLILLLTRPTHPFLPIKYPEALMSDYYEPLGSSHFKLDPRQ